MNRNRNSIARWTQEETENLRKYVDNGLSDEEISVKMNKSGSAIYSKREGLGLKQNHAKCVFFSITDDEKMWDLHKSGKSPAEIAKIMDRSYNSIRMRLYNSKNHRVVTWLNDEIELVKKLRKENKPISEISSTVKKPKSNVSRLLLELGIHKKTKARWAEDDVIKIVKKLDKGYSIKDISSILQRGPCSIVKFCIKRGMRNIYPQINIFLEKEDFNELSFIEKTLDGRLTRIKSHAKERGLEFGIDINDLLFLYKEQKGLCYYTRIKMPLDMGNRDIISIDRIDSSKGYIKGNIVLSLAIVNKMKQDLTQDEFYRYCNIIASIAQEKGKL